MGGVKREQISSKSRCAGAELLILSIWQRGAGLKQLQPRAVLPPNSSSAESMSGRDSGTTGAKP